MPLLLDKDGKPITNHVLPQPEATALVTQNSMGKTVEITLEPSKEKEKKKRKYYQK